MKCKNLLVVLGVFLVILCNSIVYGALNTDMFIDGDAYVRVDGNIRLTGIKVIEQIGGAYEVYNCDYSKDTTSIQVTLPSSDSFIVYEVTITNKGDIDYEVINIVEESYSNDNIKYEIIDLEKGTVVDGDTTHTFKIKLTTTENDSENKGILVLKYTFEEWVPSLYKMVAHKSRSLDTNLDFGVAPTKETSGVYEMDSTKDDEFPVYYYRGIVENNNVNFAGFCWKVVRTTSTGGVKLIYNGVPGSDGSCDNTGEASQIGTSAFNTSYTSINDVSYMYDNGNDSEIKKVIDKWYSDNMVEYTGMLEDEVWCNDKVSWRTYMSNIDFKGYERYITTPNIVCLNNNDKFTINNIKGNGKLKYKIGLLSMDEIKFAGIYSNGSLSYLATGSPWWSLTPYRFNINDGVGSYIFFVNSDNNFIPNGVADLLNGVRPSISLVNGTMIKEGNGSVSKPYKLIEDKITKEWTFDYTGEEQEFKVPYDGVYKLETWGAQGGDSDSKFIGGKGAYSKGIINLAKGNKLYLYVGSTSSTRDGGYNGGGIASEGGAGIYINTGGGGGATDIRLEVNTNKEWNDLNSLKSRIMVASGGGGSCSHTRSGISNAGGIGGSAGGLSSLKTSNQLTINGATQTTAGAVANSSLSGSGSFGIGGNGHNYCGSGCAYTGGGGGGGYYGGGSGFDYSMGGTGGSSYISGYKGCVAIASKDDLTPRKDSEGNQCTDDTNDISCSYHYSGMIFTDAVMKAGNEVMPTKDGLSTMIGNSGNGYAKITLVSK